MDTPPPPSPDLPPPYEPPAQPSGSRLEVAIRASVGFGLYFSFGIASLKTPVVGLLWAALLIAAVITALKGIYRGFALGVLLAIGVSLLGVGLCFLAISNLHM